MANITGDYWQFYLEGRGAKRLLRHDIAEDALAEEIVSSGVSFRDAVLAACVRATAPLESGRSKKTWVGEHGTEIAAAGGNADDAYAAYLRGLADELAYALEPGVVEEIGKRFDDETGDEEGDDDDDENDDDDEEEEDA
jgi:hypothetical protein